jgi:ubiquinone/menaquinone biosynthesis C-methylase UbiE
VADRTRATARELAQRHVAGGDPLGWFEVLYATSEGDSLSIPWADLSPNPNLVSWFEQQRAAGSGRRALKIGCGLGDDAEELSRRGFDTTAFDISSTAIRWCRRRFPGSSVGYVEADLLQPPDEWAQGFDLVLESYTLQVLPSELRSEAMRCVADFVAPGGTLLVIARGREPGEAEGAMPWPLTRQELGVFTEAGLTELQFEDYVDDESPPVRRFRVTYARAASVGRSCAMRWRFRQRRRHMTRSRVPETNQGIQGQLTVEIYDQMQRRLRDKGWIETGDITKSGITNGLALEIGPGPGYLGLEWLKTTEGTTLKGLDISADMIAVAERNARAYGLSERVEYVRSSGARLPFEDGLFDAVFTASSLHEWSEPNGTLQEAWRVLKAGGRLFISDFRRDMFPLFKWCLWLIAKPKAIRPGLLTSINAAYTPDEVEALIRETDLSSCEVARSPIGLEVFGTKRMR